VLLQASTNARFRVREITIARHAVTLPAVNYEVYGKALLGRDDQITPLI
jgi:hypothetical protein